MAGVTLVRNAVTALVAVLALALVGCGSSSTDDSKTGVVGKSYTPQRVAPQKVAGGPAANTAAKD